MRTTWEYKVNRCDGRKDELQGYLNSFGENGWEVILVNPISNHGWTDYFVIYKRPVVSE